MSMGFLHCKKQGGARSEARIDATTTTYLKMPERRLAPRIGFGLANGIGAAVTAFLSVMRQHFLRWPFHPMGYV